MNLRKSKKKEDIAQPCGEHFCLLPFTDGALPNLSSQIIFWSIAIIGTALDLYSKAAIFDWISRTSPAQGSVTIIDGFLRMVMAENAGAAFGIASGQRVMLVSVSVIALIIILVVFFFSGKMSKTFHVAFGLFTAGICGNLYDRIFNFGRVRDFIDVVYWPGKHWPAFNVADSMLCIAVGLLLISSFLTPQPCQKHAQQQK